MAVKPAITVPPKKLVNFRLPVSLVDELDEWCKANGVSKTFVAETAISEFLAKVSER